MIFAGVSAVYFRRLGHLPPLKAAAAFLAIVVALDLFVVALLIEKSLDMFRSPLGTWLPFLLIFLSSWMTGNAAQRKA